MINLKIIYRVIGALLFIEAALQLGCLGVSLIYQEDDTLAFVISLLVTVFSAVTLSYAGQNGKNTLGRRDAYLLVTLAWTVFSLFGTLPFLISGYIGNFTDAFFEAMSGFTTTGATVINDLRKMPHGIIFWRSLMQWIGGLGIVFFTIALLPSLGGSGTIRVFSAEATGPIRSKLHPRLSVSAKAIWSVFLILTLACVACFKIFGMNWFDSINYAMTTTATGGFAPHNEGIVFFHNPALEYTQIVFCFLSGINFTLLFYTITHFDLHAFLRNSEIKFYCSLVLIATIFFTVELISANGYDIEKAFRCAAFQVVAFITTTGVFNDDVATWPNVTWAVLALLMFIGGCSGSTSGGLKSVRGVMLLKVIRNEFRQMLHPNAVLPLRINDVNVQPQKRVTLLALLSIWILFAMGGTFVMVAYGIDLVNAADIAISSLSNVGPTLGIDVGPAMSWSGLPTGAKWLCSFMMLMGRLEIFTVLIIFAPSFWNKN